VLKTLIDTVEGLRTFKSIAVNFANTLDKRFEKNKRNKLDGMGQDMRGKASTHAGDSIY